MLDYGWGNPSSIMLNGEETEQNTVPNRPEYDFYATQNFTETETPNFINTDQPNFNPNLNLQFHPNPTTNFTNFYDPRAYSPYHVPMLSLEPSDPNGLFMMEPKSEPMFNNTTTTTDHHHQFNNNNSSTRLGLNLGLGGRTYFASSEDDFVNRLYRRSRILEPGSMMNFPRCQAEGCNADLTNAKHYHRRHKVCEFHSKAATTVIANLTQRFCQQCSRFHLLSEFDNGKRSCRRRLADHNRRRRKSSQQSNQENKSKLEGDAAPNSSSENLTRSPPDSEPHSSSVTVAISPPRISLDCFGHRSSTSSIFYSNE